MSLISVKLVDTYEDSAVFAAVSAHFSALAVEKDLSPETRVLIKPNLLTGSAPARAVTTHPAVVAAVIRWLKERGVKNIVVADSPGGPYSAVRLNSVYAAVGYNTPEIEPHLNRTFQFRPAPRPAGSLRSFNVITPALEADYIINLPKLKTHGMTILSAGIKNLFGVIPGLQKPEMHYRFPDLELFSAMLVDLAAFVQPGVTLIDGVDAMEGNGPSGGTVRHAGITFASRDLFTQDWFAASFMGLSPQAVPMLRIAKERGLVHDESCRFTGDPIPANAAPFAMPDTAKIDFMDSLPGFLKKPGFAVADRLLRPVPVVSAEKCIGCGKCMESCPPHVIEIKNRKAKMRRKGCISCFCCQEMCPVQAISAKRIVRF